MTLTYNVPVEVTNHQYNYILKHYSWICACRRDEEGKYWIMLWLVKHRKEIENYLKSTNQI